MKSITYLYFNGQCEAAFKFYEQCLGGKIVDAITYGDTPTDSPMAAQVSPESRHQIMHTHLVVGNVELMGSDASCEYFEKPQGFSVSLQFAFADAAEGERIFHVLAENGTIRMPLEETFWASRFGMLVDQFGTPWMINCAPAA
ncbi:MAG: VOC family protein [Thermosynechococcaceae cyanobacterium]